MSRHDPLFTGEVRALSAAIVLACLILAAVVLSEIGAFLVKRIVILAAIGAATIALAGCGTTGQSQADLLKQLDTNFAGCERHITFQAGVGVITPGASVSGSVDCKGAAPAVLPPPAP